MRKKGYGSGCPASSVFAEGWPLSQSPVDISPLFPTGPYTHCIGPFYDEQMDPDMVTEVPKGTWIAQKS